MMYARECAGPHQTGGWTQAATLAPISSPSKNTAAATNRRAIRLALLDPAALAAWNDPPSITALPRKIVAFFATTEEATQVTLPVHPLKESP